MQQTAKAITKFQRIQPRKARLVANLVRGLLVEEALAQLSFCAMKPARNIKKTLQSAIANGEMAHDFRRDSMYVHEIKVDVGPSLKRSKSKSKGGRVPILKRTSHVTVVVAEAKQKSTRS